MHALNVSGNFQRNLIILLCVGMPWLNPFSNSPSTAVTPLLISWMAAACALMAVVEMPLLQQRWSMFSRVITIVLTVWAGVSLVCVPMVIDRALTAGLIASLMCIALMIAVGRRAAVDDELLCWLAGSLLLAAVISAVLGVLQYLDLARELGPWVNQPLRGDAFANLRQRNQFASLTSLGLVVVLGGVAVQVQRQNMTRMKWLGCLLILNALAAGVACSVSRTGAIQWAVAGVVFALWARTRDWSSPSHQARPRHQLVAIALGAPVLVVVWSVLMPLLALHFTGEWGASLILRIAGQAKDYATCGARGVLWSNVLTLIAQHPFIGWGWGETDYAHFMTRYSGVRFCDMLDNAHDFALHLALEFGIAFAVVFMLSVLVWVVRRAPWREVQPWRMAAWCILAVLVIHSLLEYPLWYGPFQMTLGLAVGVLWNAPTEGELKHTREQMGSMVVAAVLFIGCLYAAWDFNRVVQIYRPAASRDLVYQDNPLHHAKQSWVFKNQADFAELTTLEVTADNAAQVYPLASRLMHYSPEARVVQRLIDSAKLLGYEEEAQFLAERLNDVKQSTPR